MPAFNMFLSDDATAVDRLIDACKKKVVAEEDLQQRALMPYFADAASEDEAVSAMLRKLSDTRRAIGAKNDRSGSPSSSDGSDTAQAAASPSRTRTPKAKGSRPVKSAKTSPAPAAKTPLPQQHSRSSPVFNSPTGQPGARIKSSYGAPAAGTKKMAPAAAAGAAACPGMFTSPKASAVPMPSFLLRRVLTAAAGAADDSTVYPARMMAVPMMMALPMMVVA